MSEEAVHFMKIWDVFIEKQTDMYVHLDARIKSLETQMVLAEKAMKALHGALESLGEVVEELDNA